MDSVRSEVEEVVFMRFCMETVHQTCIRNAVFPFGSDPVGLYLTHGDRNMKNRGLATSPHLFFTIACECLASQGHCMDSSSTVYNDLEVQDAIHSSMFPCCPQELGNQLKSESGL